MAVAGPVRMERPISRTGPRWLRGRATAASKTRPALMFTVSNAAPRARTAWSASTAGTPRRMTAWRKVSPGAIRIATFSGLAKPGRASDWAKASLCKAAMAAASSGRRAGEWLSCSVSRQPSTSAETPATQTMIRGRYRVGGRRGSNSCIVPPNDDAQDIMMADQTLQRPDRSRWEDDGRKWLNASNFSRRVVNALRTRLQVIVFRRPGLQNCSCTCGSWSQQLFDQVRRAA